MSLRAPLFSLIPEQTVQVARAAFPKGNPYTEWVGYKVHLSETCDAEYPHLLTDVQTTHGDDA